ncbi:MAG: FkbM family methyltransferase [Gaiellaceae bacterium]
MLRERVSEIAAHLVRLLVIYVPPRRRGIRLTHLVERYCGTPSQPMRARHISGFSVTCDLRDGVQRALFYCGTYEPKTTALISSALRSGDTFLDIGANAGHYTFVAARIVAPSGRVVAVEASGTTARQLCADVARNDLDAVVTVHNVAAGDCVSSALLYASEDPSQVGMWHLDPAGQGHVVGETHVTPLDDLVPNLQPDVIKLDIEGAELRALMGMRKILGNSRPRLIVAETEDDLLLRFGDSVDALVGFLDEMGYQADEIGERRLSHSRAFRPRTP